MTDHKTACRSKQTPISAALTRAAIVGAGAGSTLLCQLETSDELLELAISALRAAKTQAMLLYDTYYVHHNEDGEGCTHITAAIDQLTGQTGAAALLLDTLVREKQSAPTTTTLHCIKGGRS